MSPAPNRFHQKILRNIVVTLEKHFETHPVGEIYFAPCDVFLTDLNVYQPDLVFISNSRRSILTDQGLEGAPDLVVEVLSPKTARLDKGVKKEIYARTGVDELWIVDPDSKRIQVYHLADSAEKPAGTYRGKECFQSRLFPGLRISLAKVFQR